jgi:hypothetical protein
MTIYSGRKVINIHPENVFLSLLFTYVVRLG